jgi:hypothetical protein
MCRKTENMILSAKGGIALPESLLDSKTESIETKNSKDKQNDSINKPSRRRVRFACFNNAIHESEPMSSQEFQDYYMQDEDFERCDKDIKESIIKWIRRELGREKYAQDEFTVRGLEEMIDHIQTMHCTKKSKREESQMHIQQVLQAVREQHAVGAAALDTAEQIRRVSERSSALALHQALQRAAKDESELVAKIQSSNHPPACRLPQPEPVNQDCAPPEHRSTTAQRMLSFFKRRK